MANKFESFLKKVGTVTEHGLEKILPIAIRAATVAVPVLAVSGNAPAAAVIQTIIGIVVQTEQKYAATPGTGQQKFAEAVAVASPAVTALLSNAGVTVNATTVNAWVQVVVDALNMVPAAELDAAIVAAGVQTVKAA